MVLATTCRLVILITFVLGCAAPQAAIAQSAKSAADFPSRPIRFLSTAVPGAGNDTTTRAIAHKLTQAWGQQVIVDI